jgi:hypothetical protein
MEGRKIKYCIDKIGKKVIQNKIQDFKNTLKQNKTKLYSKPTYEVGSV